MPALITAEPGPAFLAPVAAGILPARDVALGIGLEQGSSCQHLGTFPGAESLPTPLPSLQCSVP